MKRRLPPTPLLVLAAVVLAAAAAAILIRPDADDVEAFFDGGGAFGPVLFAAAYALLTVLLFPEAPLTIAAGALYGVAGGALLSVIGATVGATASFLTTTAAPAADAPRPSATRPEIRTYGGSSGRPSSSSPRSACSPP